MPSQTTTDHLLLIEASNNEHQMAPLIEQLGQISSLDPFTLRQRLIGSAMAQLASGSKAQLRPLATLLEQHHIEHWLIASSRDVVAPQLTNGLTIDAERVVFTTALTAQNHTSSKLSLHKGSNILAVVADISGQLAEKQVKRLLVHTTYSGNAPAPLGPEELQREIFKQLPAVDLYWCNEDNEKIQAVRILPGSFDHHQLGDRAGMSRNGNLRTLVEIIAQYAGTFQLDVRFGLGFLPTCRLEKSSAKELSAISKNNFNALTNYGNLLLAIRESKAQNDSDNQYINNRLAAENTASALPMAQELFDTIGLGEASAATTAATGISPAETESAVKTPAAKPTSTTTGKPALPPPPDVETSSGVKLYLSNWRLLAVTTAVVLAGIASGSRHLELSALRWGINSGTIPALLCAASLWGAFYFWRLKRRIENTPTSKARSAAMGMVEVHGRARRLYALVSPISQLPCVYYCLKKYQRRRSDDAWRLTRVTSSGNIPFLLEDDSGKIQIDPRGAILKPKFSSEGFPGQSNILFSSASESSQYEKWREEVLHEGSNLYVMGFAHSAPNNNGGTVNDTVKQKLRDLKTDRNALMRYDKDGDGNIDAGEWDQARSDMEQQALREKLHSSRQRSNQQLIIGKPPQKGLPFIIAETESEAKLVRNYSWYAPALLTIASASLIWALYNSNRFFHYFH